MIHVQGQLGSEVNLPWKTSLVQRPGLHAAASDFPFCSPFTMDSGRQEICPITFNSGFIPWCQSYVLYTYVTYNEELTIREMSGSSIVVMQSDFPSTQTVINGYAITQKMKYCDNE
ncbi:uncharacterized protein [Venturia canescens]|uniref:uncharacterized protein n=1 Tax=Venturia canescens TaxID=32260 RepID=UPI001C9C4B4C|nr:uncharacterized protein LOC122419253 [Venturia canescens]